MSKSIRIRTEPGVDTNIKVNIEQDFDTLDILSLKMTQTEAYTSLCADFGVVVGRVFTNGGYGIPNARVSIFVPIEDLDEDNPVINEIYPYKTISSRNEEGYRYNLLPKTKQHSGHTPTGTFPSKLEVLTEDRVLEVYEKYYKYSAKTNDSGDFMLFGVPLGSHTLHYDLDLSDIGSQSLVPYDFVYEGVSPEKFENAYTFMSSDNLDGLPQVVSTQKTINVEPFWGNPELCQIGITRSDFDLKERGVRIDPYSIMMGGTFTDSGKDAITVRCNVDNQMGEKCRLTTFKGDIESIRFSGEYETNDEGKVDLSRPILESLKIDSQIDENGVFFYRVPMNLKYITTDEFGYIVESKDPDIGIPTQGNYRFRFSLNEDTGAKNSFTGKYLVPNVREYHINDGEFFGNYNTIDSKSYAFSTVLDDYPTQAHSEISGTSQSALNNGQAGVPQDYFYQFRYSRVYSASSFLNRYEKKSWLERTFNFLVRDRNESFIGIKEIWPSEKDDCATTNNYFPINDAVRNHRFNFFILTVISFIEYIGLRIQLFFKEITTQILFAIADILSNTGVSNKAAAKMFRRAKEFQFRNIFKLQLITYPDCYDCEEDNEENETETNVVAMSQLEIDDFANNNSPIFVDKIFLEKYMVASDNCAEYVITNNTGSQISVSYNDCGGVLTVLTINSGSTNGSVKGEENQTSTFQSASLTVDSSTVLNDASSFNPDDDLYIPSNVIAVPTGTNTPNNGSNLFMTYIIGIDVLGSGIQYFGGGIGQQYDIIYDEDTTTWKLSGVYGLINQGISSAFNTPLDSTQNGTCHINQGEIKIKEIYKVADILIEDVIFTEVESGCSKYDFIIEDEAGRNGDMKLRPFEGPLQEKNGNPLLTYASARDYLLSNQPMSGLPWNVGYQTWAQYKLTTSDEYTNKITGEGEGECDDRPEYNVLAVVSEHNKRFTSSINSNDFKNNTPHCIINGRYYGEVKKKGPYYTDNSLTKDGTLSGFSEFRDGVFTIVPLAGRNGELLNTYRRRKLFGKLMCGGVISYTFSNSWINGALYFFQFVKKGGNKWCKDCLYKKVDETGTHYYYRSTPYSEDFKEGETQYNYTNDGSEIGVNSELTDEYDNKRSGFHGVRKIFNTNGMSGLQGSQVEINFPTTVVDLGPRNTWLNEITTDAELDPNCSISRSIGSTSYKGVDDLMEYIIQSKEIKERGRLDVQDLFDSRKGSIDGDIAQLLNFNTQTGIYPFENEELDSPYMSLYSSTFDSKGPIGLKFFYSEDDPDTVELEQSGVLVRSCLNEPGRLGDTSQRVPYFMWNTKGHGFGEFPTWGTDNGSDYGEKQDYMRSMVFNQRIQQFKANLNEDLNYDTSDNEYFKPYLLPPIVDCIEIDAVKLKANDNYKEYTVDGEPTHIMEIGVPFHYHLGLRKGKTSYDKFVENYGPK